MEKPNEQEGNPTVNVVKPNEQEGNPTVNVEKPKKSPKLDQKKFVRVRPPVYEREVSIYEQTTLEKIKNFREARSQWILKREEKQKMFTDDTEGVKDSYLYTGRCAWIRKLGRKNSLLREHYHSIRPLRYWTLKRKATSYDEDEEMYRILNDLKAERAKKEKFQDPCQEVSLWTKEDMEECQDQISLLKGKRAQRMKKKECQEKRAKGPCKKALKRLKEAKLSEGLLESCKCDAGREVTVVIKGFCLCDQTGLNKIDLSKVCDGYQKKDDLVLSSSSKSRESGLNLRQIGKLNLNEEYLGKKEPPPKDQRTAKAETKPTVAPVERKLDPSNSLLLAKKKTEALQKYEETEKDEPLKEGTQNKEVSKTENESETSFIHNRKVTFKNDGNLKGDGGGTRGTPSDLTLFRKLSSASDRSFPKGRTQEMPAHALHEYEVPTTSDSLRTLLESKKYAKEMPETDSMNNLLSNEDGEAIKVNFKKKHKKTEEEDIKIGTKNGSPKRKLSNLAVNGLSQISSSLEIHKRHMKINQSELETKSSSLLKDLTKEKESKKKNEKPAPKVKLNPVPKVISTDDVLFLNEHEKEKEKEMLATRNVETTPEKIMPTNSEKTQDDFDKKRDGGKIPVEPFSPVVYEEKDNQQGERSVKVKDLKFTTSETLWDAKKPPPKNLYKKRDNSFSTFEPTRVPVKTKKEELQLRTEPDRKQSEQDVTRLLKKKVSNEGHIVPASEVEVENVPEESNEPKFVMARKDFEKQRAKFSGNLTRKLTEEPRQCANCNEEEEDKESRGILLELKDSSEKDVTADTERPALRDDASMITLYKNKSGVKSELGLTKEELMKMRLTGMENTTEGNELKESRDLKAKPNVSH